MSERRISSEQSRNLPADLSDSFPFYVCTVSVAHSLSREFCAANPTKKLSFIVSDLSHWNYVTNKRAICDQFGRR